MTWLETLKAIKEEGLKARKAGLAIHDNPYNFITEAAQAYAWEAGYGSAA